jgi:hypothetical protein
MATEGAGGLSTTAIERCIDNWETETQDGAEIPAARAELAALVGEAGRATALAAALVELRESAVELDAAREPRDVALERTALARHRAALAACYRLAIDAGSGAAGARDAASVVAASRAVWDTWRAFDAALQTRDWAGHDKRKGDYYAALDALGDALDAPRAGGAGEGEAT